VLLGKLIYGSGFSHARRLDDGGIMRVHWGATALTIVVDLDVLPEAALGIALEFEVPRFHGGWRANQTKEEAIYRTSMNIPSSWSSRGRRGALDATAGVSA